MEYPLTKLIMSIILIIIGFIYFILPVKAIKTIHFINKDFNASDKLVTKYKYGGLLIFLLGIYSLLVAFGVLPVFTF